MLAPGSEQHLSSRSTAAARQEDNRTMTDKRSKSSLGTTDALVEVESAHRAGLISQRGRDEISDSTFLF